MQLEYSKLTTQRFKATFIHGMLVISLILIYIETRVTFIDGEQLMAVNVT